LILCIGLSPAWQRVLHFDPLRPGEVNRAVESRTFASGKIVNVLVTLNALDAPAHCLTFCGGMEGQALRDDIKRLGASIEGIETRTRTRVCTTIIDRSTQQVTELVENTAPVEVDELDALRTACETHAARASVAVVSGSMPVGAPADTFRRLLEGLDLDIIADIRGPELLEILPLRPLVVKPNREELARTLDTPIESEEELRQAMQEIHARGAQWVVVSQGADAMLALGNQTFYRFEPPAVDCVNPIGAGDAFAAGLAEAYSRNLEMTDAIRHGIATAVDKVCHLLQSEVSSAGVRSWLTQISMEKLA
jgi:1-phosphofructokinase family hexose kinase